jgi:hypothetical protein
LDKLLEEFDLNFGDLLDLEMSYLYDLGIFSRTQGTTPRTTQRTTQSTTQSTTQITILSNSPPTPSDSSAAVSSNAQSSSPAPAQQEPVVVRQATAQEGVSKLTVTSRTLNVRFTILQKVSESGADTVESALAAKVSDAQTLDEHLKSLNYEDPKQRRVIAQMLVNGIEPDPSDQFFDGVMYSWGNISCNLNPGDVFCINGSMVAYGGDPAGAPGSIEGKGRVTFNSGNVLMQYDPKKAGLLTPTVTLKRVQWNSY